MTEPHPDLPEGHYRTVIDKMLEGKVVPFLGAGANLCGRAENAPWEVGKNLPMGSELAEHLADKFGYPSEEVKDLLLVSQYGEIEEGRGALYDALHSLFAGEYEPSPLHEFLARMPAAVRGRKRAPRYQLIVTTNYDDALERALTAEQTPFDLVWYEAKDGEYLGKFFHRAPDGTERPIEHPNRDMNLALDRNPIVFKLHGAVNRNEPDRDSYVITEENYIDYLGRSDMSNLFPISVKQIMKKSHFLFLGYSLQDWNLRAILHRIWIEQGGQDYKSWAIQWNRRASTLDGLFWRRRNVDIFNVRLEKYVRRLQEVLDAVPREASS